MSIRNYSLIANLSIILSAKDNVKQSYPQIINGAEMIKTDILQNKISFKMLEPIFRDKFKKLMEKHSLRFQGICLPEIYSFHGFVSS
jgi:hypothetical protein